MSTYVVGDIHGCLDELKTLLTTINFNEQHDTLIAVGDLVNRGPKSLETLRFLKAMPCFECTLGNHDLYLLALWQGVQYTKTLLHPILEVEDCDSLMQWLLNKPLMLQKQNWTIVHAGIPPCWNLDEARAHATATSQAYQKDPQRFFHTMIGDTPSLWSPSLHPEQQERFAINALTRMRLVSPQGALVLKKTPSPKDLPWFQHPKHGFTEDKPIIFGHWAALNGQTNHEYAIGVDTGCVWGNKLTAMRLEDKKKFSVPSLQNPKQR